MTSISGNTFPPGSPQAKLADRGWRWRNSWWIFAPLLGCGFFGFIGFLVAAIRTGKRYYWIWTAVYATMGVLAMVLIIAAGEKGTARYDALSGIAMVPFLFAVFGPIVHAAIKNRDYLTTIAHKGPWYAQPQAPATPANNPSTFMGVSNSDYFVNSHSTPPPPPAYQQPPSVVAAYQPPPPPVAQPTTYETTGRLSSETELGSPPLSSAGRPDINQVGQAELAAVLGIDGALAAQVTSARARYGRFVNVDDLANKANLQPHQLIRFRNRVTFGGDGNGPQQDRPTGQTGRILDF